MRLNQIRHQGDYVIQKIHQSSVSKRLGSYGIRKNSTIYYTGIKTGKYRIIISDDHLLAVDENICCQVQL